MKKIQLLILSFLFSSALFSQAYHPLIRPNIYWDVMRVSKSEWCGYNGGERYLFSGDTTVNGVDYHLIIAHPVGGTSIPGGNYCPPFAVILTIKLDQFVGYYSVLIREDVTAKKVFVYDKQKGESLLYDFNLTKGDSLKTVKFSTSVDSVGIVKLNTGETRKIIYLHNKEYYIESVGGSQGLQFYPYNPGSGFGYANEPICLVENKVTLYWNKCIATVGIGDSPANSAAKLYPNPATDLLYIEKNIQSTVELTVMDLTGRIVLIQQLTSEKHKVDVSELSEGVYLYKINNGKEGARGKFIVRR
jgi:hypothetical protein